MTAENVLPIVEAVLRIVVGLRFLSSGLDNVRRWPNATHTAAIVSRSGTTLLGSLAVALMVLGGAGLPLGLQTPLSALCLIVFLIPTFRVHAYWLQSLPERTKLVTAALADRRASQEFAIVARHALHGHETGWRENLVLLAACCYFLVRGTSALGLDVWLDAWVIRLLD